MRDGCRGQPSVPVEHGLRLLLQGASVLARGAIPRHLGLVGLHGFAHLEKLESDGLRHGGDLVLLRRFRSDRKDFLDAPAAVGYAAGIVVHQVLLAMKLRGVPLRGRLEQFLELPLLLLQLRPFLGRQALPVLQHLSLCCGCRYVLDVVVVLDVTDNTDAGLGGNGCNRRPPFSRAFGLRHDRGIQQAVPKFAVGRPRREHSRARRGQSAAENLRDSRKTVIPAGARSGKAGTATADQHPRGFSRLPAAGRHPG